MVKVPAVPLCLAVPTLGVAGVSYASTNQYVLRGFATQRVDVALTGPLGPGVGGQGSRGRVDVRIPVLTFLWLVPHTTP